MGWNEMAQCSRFSTHGKQRWLISPPWNSHPLPLHQYCANQYFFWGVTLFNACWLALMLLYKGPLLCNYKQTQVELVCLLYSVTCMHVSGCLIFVSFYITVRSCKEDSFHIGYKFAGTCSYEFVMLFEFIAFLLCLSNYHAIFHCRTCHPFFCA